MQSWTDRDDIVGMGYQKFAVDPLMPLTLETELRLAQLRCDLSHVEGHTVLDIGTYAGLASLVCIEKQARHVCATDVDDTFFIPIGNWIEQTNAPMSLLKADFNELEVELYDDVLFLEVYHWLNIQGLTAESVARKLNTLARLSILIETPYDTTDPSVLRFGEKAMESYQPSILIDTLSNLGWRVEFLGLCNYFPKEYKRARFLCKK